jgi:hypothetical protein
LGEVSLDDNGIRVSAAWRKNMPPFREIRAENTKFYLADASLKYCIMGFDPMSIDLAAAER